MERRYNDKERAWRDTFSRLRLHLGVGELGEEQAAVRSEVTKMKLQQLVISGWWFGYLWIFVSSNDWEFQ